MVLFDVGWPLGTSLWSGSPSTCPNLRVPSLPWSQQHWRHQDKFPDQSFQRSDPNQILALQGHPLPGCFGGSTKSRCLPTLRGWWGIMCVECNYYGKPAAFYYSFRGIPLPLLQPSFLLLAVRKSRKGLISILTLTWRNRNLGEIFRTCSVLHLAQPTTCSMFYVYDITPSSPGTCGKPHGTFFSPMHN